MRYRPHVPAGTISGRDGYPVSAQKVPGKALGLHVSEIQPEAHMGAAAERHKSEFMPPARGLHGEARGVVALRLGPNLRQVMGVKRIDIDAGATRNVVTHELERAHRPARQRW